MSPRALSHEAVRRAMRAIARDALRVGVGGTLPRSTDYQHRLGTGASSVQRAVDALVELGGIAVASRGHLGRVLTAVDLPTLWASADLGLVRLVLPPTGALEVALACRALADSLAALAVPSTNQTLRGGSRRVAALAGGDGDLTIVSGAVVGQLGGGQSAEAADVVRPDPLFAVRDLGEGTYYGPGRVVTVWRQGAEPRGRLRVAIDPDSPDHVAFTEAQFDAARCDFVAWPFPLVPAAVAGGEVDAGIWHITRSVIPLPLAGLRTEPLTARACAVVAASSAAAVISPADRPELTALVRALDLADLPERQRTLLHEDPASPAVRELEWGI